MVNKHQNNILFLDGIRGLAAFYVMVGHARWLLWEGFSEGYIKHPELYNTFEKAMVYFLSLFRYGHEAVLLFFVLSGFVIHLRYSKQIKESGNNITFDYLPYLKRRIKRIYPPLLSALLITYILDQIGIRTEFPIYNGHTIYHSINENIGSNHSIGTLFGNLGFLMRFHTPVFGSNGPLWSLAYEWWFYIFYPLILSISKRNLIRGIITVSLLYAITTTIGFHIVLLDKVLTLLPTWWIGTLLADIYTGRISIKFKYLTPLSIFLFLLPFDIFHLPIAGAMEFMWTLGFAGLFSICFFLQEKGYKTILEYLKPLGDISYSLYVIHMPIVVFMSGWILQTSGNQLLPQSFKYVLLGIIVSILAAIFSYFLVEKPFIKKRN